MITEKFTKNDSVTMMKDNADKKIRQFDFECPGQFDSVIFQREGDLPSVFSKSLVLMCSEAVCRDKYYFLRNGHENNFPF